ncbi:transcriptional regulator [Holotrichia oblita]|uniref:Transcriptional regulator n=1 Tax=Holotrichia oblita TaxID=644536 RepID=A0ACB9TGN0_HOLOL|nr:transcriptional regulator [Holotrichia oblita]
MEKKLEDFSIVLSTMSPNINSSSKKIKSKKVSKLALKTQLRRSSIYDKLPYIVQNNVVSGSETTDTWSTSSGNSRKEAEHKYINSKNLKKSTKLPHNRKFNEIEKWIAQINIEHDKMEDIEECNKTVFSEISTIISERKKMTEISDDSNIHFATNSTFVNDKNCFRFDEMFQQKGIELKNAVKEKDNVDTTCKSNDKVSDRNENNNSILIINDSYDEQQQFETPIKTKTEISEYENLLDELYGNSWRANKERVLTFSEPKQKKIGKMKEKQIVSKTERRQASNNIALNKKSTFETANKDKNRLKKINTNTYNDKNNIDNTAKGDKQNKVKKVSKVNTTERQEVNGLENKIRERVKPDDCTKNKRPTSKNSIKYYHTSSSDSEDNSDKIYINKKHSKIEANGQLSFLSSLSASVPVDKCDASAKIFRSTYKISKGELAKRLFQLYNEEIFSNAIPQDTLLEWSDRMRGTAGFCYCRKITRRTGVIERTTKIVLATKIVDSADRLRDTLVHEMCHAATWIVNEISDGHGPYWKAWAAKAMKVFPELPPIKRCHDYAINTKYTYKCSECSYSFGRHTKSLDIEKKCCGYCHGRFEVFINKTTKTGKKAVTPVTPKKQPTGFALFVKENYGNVKQNNITHAEVMKILSTKFAELKTK